MTAKLNITMTDPVGRNITGVPTKTITNVPATTPAGPISNANMSSTVNPTATKTPVATKVAPVVAAAPAVQEPQAQGAKAGQTITLSAEDYAAGVAKVGKEKMDASMQKFLNQGGTLASDKTSVTGDLVSSKNELVQPVTPEPTKTTPEVAPDGTVTPPEKVEPAPTKTQVDLNTKIPSTEYAPANEQDAFQTLMKGGKLVDTPETRKWTNQYNTFQSLNSMDVNSLADMMTNGEIATKYQNMLSTYSPQKYAEMIQKYNDDAAVNSINQASENLMKSISGETISQNKRSEEILKLLIREFNATPSSVKDLRAKYYEGNDNMKQYQKEVAQYDSEIDTVQELMRKTEEELRTRFPDVPQGALLGFAAKQNYDLTQKLNTLIKQRNLSFANYQAEKDDMDMEIEFEKMRIAEERQDRNDSMKFLETIYGTTKADEVRAEDIAIADRRIQDQMNFAREQATTAFERGDMQDAKAWQRELQKMEISRQTNLEYLREQNKNANVDIKYETDPDTGMVTGVVKTDKTTGLSTRSVVGQDGVAGEQILVNNGNTAVNVGQDETGSFIDFEIPNGATLAEPQCGQFYNNVTDGEKPVGDEYTSKAKWIEPGREPQAGDAFVSNIGVKDPNTDYGHIGIVTKIIKDSNGKVTGLEVQDSNAYGDKVFRKRIINSSDPMFKSITGYFPTKLTQSNVAPEQKVDRRIVDNVLANLTQTVGAQWKDSSTRRDFVRMLENNPLGSDAVVNYVNNIVAGRKTGAAADQWDKTIVSESGLTNILDMMNQFEQEYGQGAGEIFGYSGALQSKIDELQSKAKATPVSSPTYKRIQLQTAILKEMQQYRNSVTGAAASDLETKEYSQLFPSGSDSASVSKAKVEAIRNSMQRKIAKEQEMVLGGKDAYAHIIKGEKNGSTVKPTTSYSSIGSNNDKFSTYESPASFGPSGLNWIWNKIFPTASSALSAANFITK